MLDRLAGAEQDDAGLVGEDGAVARSLSPLAGEHHRCAECAFVYAEVSVEAATDVVRSIPDQVRAATDGHEDAHLRARPANGAWSALEYVCHIRDVYAVYTIRLHRTRVEDTPVLEPMLNDLRVVRFRYNNREIHSVLDELDDNVAGFLDEIARNTAEKWARSARRLPGEERTARWLLRQAAHEGLHHTRDVAAVLDQVAAARQ